MLALFLSSKNSSSAFAFTSGTIKGIFCCIRKCEVLSITKHPALAALGAYSAEIFPPGENRPMSAFAKSNSDKSSTKISLSLNSTFFPFDF